MTESPAEFENWIRQQRERNRETFRHQSELWERRRRYTFTDRQMQIALRSLEKKENQWQS